MDPAAFVSTHSFRLVSRTFVFVVTSTFLSLCIALHTLQAMSGGIELWPLVDKRGGLRLPQTVLSDFSSCSDNPRVYQFYSHFLREIGHEVVVLHLRHKTRVVRSIMQQGRPFRRNFDEISPKFRVFDEISSFRFFLPGTFSGSDVWCLGDCPYTGPAARLCLGTFRAHTGQNTSQPRPSGTCGFHYKAGPTGTQKPGTSNRRVGTYAAYSRLPFT